MSKIETQAHGKFILSVRVAGNESFGILSAGDDQKYDDASREKRHRRDAVLEFVKLRQAGWQHNYPRYSDAVFRIEEEVRNADGSLTLVHISGPRPESPAAIVTEVRNHLVTAGKTYNKRGKGTGQEDMANWLFLGAEDFMAMGPKGLFGKWLQLSLGERIEVCRDVAAGYYTPALVS